MTYYNNKIKFLIVTLVIVEVFVLYLMYRSLYSYNTLNTFDNEEDLSSGSFAILIQGEDGTYIENDGFPGDNYVYSETLSGCVDAYGNKIANALTYSGGTFKVHTNTTTYCYLYFDKK